MAKKNRGQVNGLVQVDVLKAEKPKRGKKFRAAVNRNIDAADYELEENRGLLGLLRKRNRAGL